MSSYQSLDFLRTRRHNVDLYTETGEKVVHLLPFLPELRDGDVILAKVGQEFGQTPAERSEIIETLKILTNGRVRIILVDESSTVEVVSSRDLRARL